ncbi:hypothetical protein N7452_006600 [Penicillium brevicompactum]|uniref:J domain-containing protein n=1 Tax=Penicillium brevicompactum TaxID=5074 RepID=A0A9W9QKV2_PENBR|nr:hypothetical protein N7452_006600 [Penicillium brevicompactum]
MPPANVTVDSYTILGIARDADIKEINAAYKRLALKFHPDKAGTGDATNARFQKVQYAVELLRDPSRRAQLDRVLDIKGKRRWAGHAPGDWPAPATDADAGRSSKRGCRGTNSGQREGGPENAFHDHFPTDRPPKRDFKKDSRGIFDQLPKRNRYHRSNDFGFSSGSSRYMYSFGNSVHMDPDSEESKASKARFRAENAQWQREWDGIDLEVERARAEARKQAMRHRVVRDMEEQLEKERAEAKKHTPHVAPFDQAICNAVNGLRSPPGVWGRTQGPTYYAGYNLMDWNNLSTINNIMYQEPKSTKPTGTEKEPIQLEDPFEAPSSPAPSVSEVLTQSSPISSSSARSYCASNRPASIIASESPTRPCSVNSGSGDHSPLGEPLDPSSPAAQLINTYLASYESSLRPLIPHFKQKLADPLGRYTANELATELQGVVLESYSAWLEDIRVSMSFGTHATARKSPEACSHLGGWYKEYGQAQCVTCQFWSPLFILTCRGCGLKGCIRCKFNGDAFVLKKH